MVETYSPKQWLVLRQKNDSAKQSSQNISADRRNAYHIARRPAVNMLQLLEANKNFQKLPEASIDFQKTH